MSASTVPPPQPNCACGLALRLFTELLTNDSMIMAMAPTFTGNSIINRKPNLSAFCTNKDRYRTEIITFDFLIRVVMRLDFFNLVLIFMFQ